LLIVDDPPISNQQSKNSNQFGQFPLITTIQQIFTVPTGLACGPVRIFGHGHYDTPSSRNRMAQLLEARTRASCRARDRRGSARTAAVASPALAIHSI
jgi:hypothetical protein